MSSQTRKRNYDKGSSKEPIAGPSNQGAGRTLRSRHDGSCRKAPDGLIVANQCCVCLQGFNEDIEIGAGTNWVQCMCTRWLHEDCILDCVIDESGKEKLCMSSLCHIITSITFFF